MSDIDRQREAQGLWPLEVDAPFSRPGAETLAAMVREYWLNKGYRGIITWVAPVKERARMFTVRSNIGPTGFPPREKQRLAA